MERLITVVQDISLARTLTELMAVVRHAARDLTGADGASFVLRDGDECYYADEEAIGPLWKGQRFPMKSCISGWVMLQREATFIEDVYVDPRVPIDAYRPTFVKSLAMVPIRAKDPIGAIGTYWAKPYRATPQEAKLLQALADCVSVAMQNLQLYKELERSNGLFKTFMDYAPFAASVRDQTGTVRFINPRMAELFESKVEELVDRNLLESARTESLKENVRRALEDDLAVLRSRAPSQTSYKVTLSTGPETHWLVTKFPIRAPGEELLIGTISIDITERVAIERSREEARGQLQQSYKMAALGEMAGGIAHEINNPLSIVIGKSRQLVELAATQPIDTAAVQEFAGTIASTAQRIAGIVHGISTISRRSDKDPCVSVDIGSLVDGTIALVASKFRRASVDLRVDGRYRQTRLECRPPEICQILLNLLGNALDAVESLQEKWVQVGAFASGDWVELTVTDSGSGVPTAVRDKIMDPFFTTKEFGKGTGLGLSISKGIVESHGGTLTLDESCPNTRFVVRLPVRQDDMGYRAYRPILGV
jgi:PAS domain S-box-containing protein